MLRADTWPRPVLEIRAAIHELLAGDPTLGDPDGVLSASIVRRRRLVTDTTDGPPGYGEVYLCRSTPASSPSRSATPWPPSATSPVAQTIPSPRPHGVAAGATFEAPDEVAAELVARPPTSTRPPQPASPPPSPRSPDGCPSLG